MSSRKEIRQEIIRITDLNESQVSTLINDNINATIQEISNPGWAFSRRNELHHNWSWLKRKTTFVTVASQEDYILSRDIANIAILRYDSPDTKLTKVSDQRFYRDQPYSTQTGNPLVFRQSTVTGLTTALTVASKINVVSSSSADTGDADLAITVWGYNNGILVSEVLTLNGTTLVNGTVTFDAKEVFISKGKDTTGTLTVTQHSTGTTIISLGTQERTPILPVVSLWPIPSAVKTIYVHYYTFIRNLRNDSDTPPFAEHWHYVVRLGALAKTYQYLNKETDTQNVHALYSSAVRAMVAEDKDDPSYIASMYRHSPFRNQTGVQRSTDDIT